MGKGEADQLPPDTVEEAGTAEMEKSMSKSEGTILQYSANVSWLATVTVTVTHSY